MTYIYYGKAYDTLYHTVRGYTVITLTYYFIKINNKRVPTSKIIIANLELLELTCN